MQNLSRLVLSVFVSALALACSDSDTGASSADFVGNYSCTATVTNTYTKPAGAPPATSTSQTNFTVLAGDSAGQLKIAVRLDASCFVTFQSSDQTATLLPSECTDSNGTQRYTSGNATFDGSKLTASLSFTVSRTDLEVSGTQTLDCKKVATAPTM